MNNNEIMQKILNVMQTVPPQEREEYIKNLYQSQNQNYTQARSQLEQLINSNNPKLQQIKMLCNQFGIRGEVNSVLMTRSLIH